MHKLVPNFVAAGALVDSKIRSGDALDDDELATLENVLRLVLAFLRRAGPEYRLVSNALQLICDNCEDWRISRVASKQLEKRRNG